MQFFLTFTTERYEKKKRVGLRENSSFYNLQAHKLANS